MFGFNHFGVFDYIAVAGTLLFSVFIGVYYGIVGNKSKEEMLVGGRNMRALPIAASMMVTYFSAIAILGYPAEIYSHGIQIYMMTILGMIFIPLSTLIYVKVFYEMKLTSVYEYLELRFDSILVRWLTSFTFILQIVLINGVVLYAPAIALLHVVGLPIWLSVSGIGIIGTVYTSIGGIKAVVWTDVFQFFMIIIGLFSIVTKGFIKAGGVATAFSIAAEKGRMVLFEIIGMIFRICLLFSFTFDPFMRHNVFNFFFGYGFTVMSLYGTHQPQVQRYCSLPSLRAAVKALLLTIPLKVFTMTIVLLTGVSIVATYAGCDPILLGEIKKADAIIPYFVIKELAFMPGMMGIFVSCIFSAVLSSVSSTLNSLSAVTWEDFISKISYFKNLKSENQAHCTKILAVIYGVLSVLVAFGAQNMGAIFQVTMTAVGATSGPLGGIFLCGLFIPFMNKYGAIGGILSGLCSMMFIAVNSFTLGKEYNLNPRLPTDLSECPIDTDYSKMGNITSLPLPPEEGFGFPEKLYTLSYILYPFIGSCITVFVGCLVSIATGGLTPRQNVDEKYFHPWIRSCSYTQKFVRLDHSYELDDLTSIKKPSANSKSKTQKDYKYEPVQQNGNGIYGNKV